MSAQTRENGEQDVSVVSGDSGTENLIAHWRKLQAVHTAVASESMGVRDTASVHVIPPAGILSEEVFGPPRCPHTPKFSSRPRLSSSVTKQTKVNSSRLSLFHSLKLSESSTATLDFSSRSIDGSSRSWLPELTKGLGGLRWCSRPEALTVGVT